MARIEWTATAKESLEAIALFVADQNQSPDRSLQIISPCYLQRSVIANSRDDGSAWMNRRQSAEHLATPPQLIEMAVSRSTILPAGDYLLSVRFYETPPAGRIRNWKFSQDAKSAKNRKQVDLGNIQLE